MWPCCSAPSILRAFYHKNVTKVLNRDNSAGFRRKHEKTARSANARAAPTAGKARHNREKRREVASRIKLEKRGTIEPKTSGTDANGNGANENPEKKAKTKAWKPQKRETAKNGQKSRHRKREKESGKAEKRSGKKKRAKKADPEST